jgi:hypothetical protein
MDQHVPAAQSPEKYRSVLFEMRRTAPWGDLFYLSGFAETLALIDKENAQQAGTHDLDISAVVRVLRAWGDFEGDDWAGGFVLEMTDGRRLYAESYADGPDWGSDACVSIVPVPADSVLPELPPSHSSELYGWVEDLPELGDYLRRLGQRESK